MNNITVKFERPTAEAGHNGRIKMQREFNQHGFDAARRAAIFWAAEHPGNVAKMFGHNPDIGEYIIGTWENNDATIVNACEEIRLAVQLQIEAPLRAGDIIVWPANVMATIADNDPMIQALCRVSQYVILCTKPRLQAVKRAGFAVSGDVRYGQAYATGIWTDPDRQKVMFVCMMGLLREDWKNNPGNP